MDHDVGIHPIVVYTALLSTASRPLTGNVTGCQPNILKSPYAQ